MATPVLVSPARCLAVRQAPWTRERLIGEAKPLGFPGGAEQREGVPPPVWRGEGPCYSSKEEEER
jgi:hypothetical protein